jgi:hypothetical protein
MFVPVCSCITTGDYLNRCARRPIGVGHLQILFLGRAPSVLALAGLRHSPSDGYFVECRHAVATNARVALKDRDFIISIEDM